MMGTDALGAHAWIIDQFIDNHEQDRELVRFTVRIDGEAAAKLAEVAEWLGLAKATVANGLLESGINQALWMKYHPESLKAVDDPEERRHWEADRAEARENRLIDQAIEEAERSR